MNNISQIEHRLYLDIFRILLIFLVVLGHSNYLNISNSLGCSIEWIAPTNTTWIYTTKFISYITHYAYTFHMPAFFMLSGFLFALSGQKYDFDKLVVNKFKRLIIPYFVCGLFFTIPCYILGSYLQLPQTLNAIQIFLNGECCDTHLWFLFALFWCFALFYPIYKFLLPKSQYLCFILLIASYFIPKSINFFCLHEGLHNLFWFGLGFYIFNYEYILQSQSILHKKTFFIATLFTIFATFVSAKFHLQKCFITRLFIVLLNTFWLYILAYRLSLKQWTINSNLLKIVLTKTIIVLKEKYA